MTKFTCAIAAALALTSCSKESEQNTGEKPATKPADAGPALTGAAAVEAVMAAYEACRVKLAADDPAIAGCAADIAKTARAAEAAAVATAAAKLAEMPAGDIETLRVGFGEVSKPIQDLLVANPEVAEKYRIYECPMVEGFNRWAERSTGPDHAKANPYMGTKMPGCGSEVRGDHGADGAGHHGGSGDLMAAEMAAHAAAKPILVEACGGCHLTENAKSKKAKKALEHFVMDSYPYSGHHAADLGKTIRKVLGVEGKKATMPKDDPGSIKGPELDAIVAWTKAWDAAAAAGVGHHGTMDHHGGDDKDGHHHGDKDGHHHGDKEGGHHGGDDKDGHHH